MPLAIEATIRSATSNWFETAYIALMTLALLPIDRASCRATFLSSTHWTPIRHSCLGALEQVREGKRAAEDRLVTGGSQGPLDKPLKGVCLQGCSQLNAGAGTFARLHLSLPSCDESADISSNVMKHSSNQQFQKRCLRMANSPRPGCPKALLSLICLIKTPETFLTALLQADRSQKPLNAVTCMQCNS